MSIFKHKIKPLYIALFLVPAQILSTQVFADINFNEREFKSEVLENDHYFEIGDLPNDEVYIVDENNIDSILVALNSDDDSTSPALFSSQNDPGRHLSYWWPSTNTRITSVPLKSFSFNSTWQLPMDRGVANWNNRNTPIHFTTSSTSNNTVSAGPRDDTWYGLASSWISGSDIVRFEIAVNSRTVSNNAINFENFVTSVFTHELGHTIGLKDNPTGTTGNGSLMNYTRDRNALVIPTTFDVASVNMLYNSN